MPFTVKEESQFKGLINNTEIFNEEKFWAIQKILRHLEDVFKNDNGFNNEIYFPENFIDDLSSELENIYLKYEEDEYSDIAEYLTQSLWFEEENLSDLEFDYMGLPRWFDFINDNLKQTKYDFKTNNLK